MSGTASSIKRKLEELEIGIPEISDSANLQVRPRREAAAKASEESEIDGLRSRERDSSSIQAGVLESTGSSGVSGAVPPGSSSPGLNGCVSNFTAAGVNATSGPNGGAASCSLSRPIVIDAPINPCRLQFFVRITHLAGRTIVLHASASDTIKSVHQLIFQRTGLPLPEQRLIFGGRQLQNEQTLQSCNVVNDATLNLVARMPPSTSRPRSWQLMNELVATIGRMCAVEHSQAAHGLKKALRHSQDTVTASVKQFLKMSSIESVRTSAKHMQVFQLAGATSALVVLLFSKVESNRACAEESIAYFLKANDEYLPAHIYCAPVILDFCKLLSKSAPNHSLYSSCRHALARLLDIVGIAHGCPYFYNAKADSIVRDFSPFANELSLRLFAKFKRISKAYITEEATRYFASDSAEEAKDLTAFLIPLCKAMEVCKGIDLSGSGPNSGRGNDGLFPSFLKFVDVALPSSNDPSPGSQGTASSTSGMGVEIGTHGWFLSLFLDLLDGIDACLAAVEKDAENSLEWPGTCISEDRERPLGYAPFLVVLKGLHSIAKLYDGAMDSFLEVLGNRSIPLNMLIRQSRWQNENSWLFEFRNLLDFVSKRKILTAMLPEFQDNHEEREAIEMLVHRSQILTESFGWLELIKADELQRGISVEFATEEATGHGVLREWFSMICREIFNCDNALFSRCPKDLRRVFPNPASDINSCHLSYFQFCGRVIALALMHRVQIDVVFAVAFFKQLAGLPISWEDAKDADPVLYDSCKKILEMDADTIDSDVLGLTFATDVVELGARKTLELCQGGKEMVVNSENRRQYVELLVHQQLVASVDEQTKAFAQGFSDLLVNGTHQQFFRELNPQDLDSLLYGDDRNICPDDWKAHTEYHDYMVTDDQIRWFWQVVEAMTPEQRRRVLFFSTSLNHLPAEGFSGLPERFHIYRAYTDISWLPTAHTCFYQLLLPSYPTFNMMRTRLHLIAEMHIAEGFGIE